MDLYIALIIGLQLVALLVLIFKKDSSLNNMLADKFEDLEKNFERLERLYRDEQTQTRSLGAQESKNQREELTNSLKLVSDSISKNIRDMSNHQVERLNYLTESNERKLEEMRHTVDEKLQGTLEKRLGESFKHVSERLEQVHKGLGEMQVLATGVGDLKKVLTNVKTRGVWGEVVLKNLLEELLTPSQFASNVKTNLNSNDLVEFAIKLPGQGDGTVWLPLDSKFPSEYYVRLVEAQDNAEVEMMETCGKELERRVKECAKDIRVKYINPPETTDFAIMFLPTEGLYSEIARRSGLLESIQRDYRVVVSGPATFAAFLNSLQMGFKTIAIEKRSSEVWNILADVKNEFGKFGDTLDAVKKKLESASNSIDETSRRSRAIERKLKDVEALP